MVVAFNLFGDIFFDFGSVCIGIIGIVLFVNLNSERIFSSFFEFVYGFASDIYGKNIVNFIVTIWVGVMMFDFFGNGDERF